MWTPSRRAKAQGPTCFVPGSGFLRQISRGFKKSRQLLYVKTDDQSRQEHIAASFAGLLTITPLRHGQNRFCVTLGLERSYDGWVMQGHAARPLDPSMMTRAGNSRRFLTRNVIIWRRMCLTAAMFILCRCQMLDTTVSAAAFQNRSRSWTAATTARQPPSGGSVTPSPELA